VPRERSEFEQGRIPFGPFFTFARSQVYVAGEVMLAVAASFGVIAARRARAIEKENRGLKHRATQAEAALTKVYLSDLRGLSRRLKFYSDERIKSLLARIGVLHAGGALLGESAALRPGQNEV